MACASRISRTPAPPLHSVRLLHPAANRGRLAALEALKGTSERPGGHTLADGSAGERLGPHCRPQSTSRAYRAGE